MMVTFQQKKLYFPSFIKIVLEHRIIFNFLIPSCTAFSFREWVLSRIIPVGQCIVQDREGLSAVTS